MSQGISCKDKSHKKDWVVTQRNANASAFNGYHSQWSEYSAVRCLRCGSSWRTKAAFVDSLPNAPADWMHRSSMDQEPGTGETPGFLEDVHRKADAKDAARAMPDLLPKRGVRVTSAMVHKLNQETE